MENASFGGGIQDSLIEPQVAGKLKISVVFAVEITASSQTPENLSVSRKKSE